MSEKVKEGNFWSDPDHYLKFLKTDKSKSYVQILMKF